MRLDTLELTAFGPFTDETLDLQAPGLHVIFGTTGAGKSTALRALHGLLFGIPPRTTDAWVHDMGDLRVGGQVRNASGAPLRFGRRKGNNHTLLDAAGAPIDDTALTAFLGGATGALFSSMFSLSRDELRAGGDALLHGGGEVGAALFGAGLGSGAVHSLLTDLEREAADLFAARGQKPKVNAGLREFEDQTREARNLSVSTLDWKKHTDALEEASDARERIDKDIAAAEKSRARAERLLSVLGPIAERSSVLAELEQLASVPDLDEGFRKERLAALADLERAELDTAAATKLIEQRRDDLKDLDAPTTLLAHQEEITDLNQRLGEYRKGRGDLPRLNGRLATEKAEATVLLRKVDPKLEIEGAEARRVTVELKTQVEDLADQRPNIQSAASLADARLKATRADIATRKQRRGELPADRDSVGLQRAVDDARAAVGLDGQLTDLRAKLVEAKKVAEREGKDLPLVSGEPGAVAALDVPIAQTVEQFAEESANRRRRDEELDREAEQLARKTEEARVALKALELGAAVPTDLELEESRERRTSGWLAVRAAWLDGDESLGTAFGEPLPEAYESSVNDADRTADLLRAEAARVARKAHLLATIEGLEREAVVVGQRRVTDAEEGAEYARQWNAEWEPLGITPLSPKEMLEWLRRHEVLRRITSEVEGLVGQVTDLEGRIEGHRTALSAALTDFGESPLEAEEPLGLGLTRADELRTTANTTRQQRLNADQEIAELEGRAADQVLELTSAQDAMNGWEKDWATAAEGLRLSPGSTVKQGLAVVAALESAFEQIAQLEETQRRIVGIERDAASFDSAARQLLQALGSEPIPHDVDSAISDLQKRSAQAQRNQATIDQAEKQIVDEQNRIESAKEIREVATARLGRLLTKGEVGTAEELESVETKAARKRDQLKRRDELEHDITKKGDDTVEALEIAAATVDSDTLTTNLNSFERSLDDLKTERDRVSETIGREQGELDRIDGSAAAAEASERAQSALAEVRDNAERYVQLQLAVAILRRAIESYRRTSQGPVLKRAKELFPSLTLGVFDGIITDFDDRDQPILLAVRDGHRVKVEHLSEGERDELYLALSVATLEHYFTTNPPMPLVLDDLFLSFDDERAKAGFTVLHELAATTQVIFFTHHEHLVALAGDTIPADNLTVHRLPAA